MVAYEAKRFDIVVQLIDIGADPNRTDREFGTTILMMAAATGNTDVVSRLIAAGADLDIVNDGGNTALRVASKARHVKVVSLLIAAGADLHAATPPSPFSWVVLLGALLACIAAISAGFAWDRAVDAAAAAAAL